jgi:hypothetical protein
VADADSKSRPHPTAPDRSATPSSHGPHVKALPPPYLRRCRHPEPYPRSVASPSNSAAEPNPSRASPSSTQASGASPSSRSCFGAPPVREEAVGAACSRRRLLQLVNDLARIFPLPSSAPLCSAPSSSSVSRLLCLSKLRSVAFYALVKSIRRIEYPNSISLYTGESTAMRHRKPRCRRPVATA